MTIEAVGEPECLLVACSANWPNSDLRSKTAPRSSGQKGSMRLVATISGLRESAGACVRLPIPDELPLALMGRGSR